MDRGAIERGAAPTIDQARLARPLAAKRLVVIVSRSSYLFTASSPG